MDLDELEKRLNKGYRVYKKIRTTLNLKDEWDFIKLKILFMRQYSQLFLDGFDPEQGYYYLQIADDYVEKRKRIQRNPYEDDVNFYKYLVEIDRTQYFILTNQYDQLLNQCEIYIDCASKLEEYKKKPINVLVPFRIYVGCGMIYEFFNQDNDIVVNAFLRGVQIIEKNIDDVGRYFLSNDLLIYVQAYVKIVKCKLKLRDFENAELWARSTLKFIDDNSYLLRLESDSSVVKKIQNLHKKALKELLAKIVIENDQKKQQKKQEDENQNEQQQSQQQSSSFQQQSPLSQQQSTSQQFSPNIFDKLKLFKLGNGSNTNRNLNSPVSITSAGSDSAKQKKSEGFPKSRFENAIKEENHNENKVETEQDLSSIQLDQSKIQIGGLSTKNEGVEQIENLNSKKDQDQFEIKEEDDEQKFDKSSATDISKRVSYKDFDFNEEQKSEDIQETKKQEQSLEIKKFNHRKLIQKLAKQLIQQNKRQQTNLVPISQIRQEIDDNQDGVDLIKVNSQFFDQEKFFNLPKQFPSSLNQLEQIFQKTDEDDRDQDTEEEEREKRYRNMSESGNQENSKSMRNSSMVSSGQKEKDIHENSLSTSIKLNQSQNKLQNDKNNISTTNLKSQKQMDGSSLINVESKQNIVSLTNIGSQTKIGSSTKIGSKMNIQNNEQRRSSFLEVPSTSLTDFNDRNNQRNITHTPKSEQQQNKGVSSRVIHLIQEDHNEEDSPLKTTQNNRRQSQTKLNQQSYKDIPVTPVSLKDMYDSPKSIFKDMSSSNIDGKHFALSNSKTPICSLDEIKQAMDNSDLNSSSYGKISYFQIKLKKNNLKIKQGFKRSTISESQSEPQIRQSKLSENEIPQSTGVYTPNQRVSSFNQIDQIPEALDDDSPHKPTDSKERILQQFNQLASQTQTFGKNENSEFIKTESDSKLNTSLRSRSRSRSPYRELSIRINSNFKDIALEDKDTILKDVTQQKIEIISPSTSSIQSPQKIINGQSQRELQMSDQQNIQNSQNMNFSNYNDGQPRRKSILSIPTSAYQSPLVTPSGALSARIRNLFRQQYSPGMDSPNSARVRIELTHVKSEVFLDMKKMNSDQSKAQRQGDTPNTQQANKADMNSSRFSKSPRMNRRDSQQSQVTNSVHISGLYNRTSSIDSNYFQKNQGSGSQYNSDYNSMGSIQTNKYQSQEGQTPANHFLVPTTNNQPRKKSIFSDQKQQAELYNQLIQMNSKIEQNKSDGSKSSSGSESSLSSPNKQKKQPEIIENKQVTQRDKLQTYLSNSEYRIKQMKKWGGGNLNKFFQVEKQTKLLRNSDKKSNEKLKIDSSNTVAKNITRASNCDVDVSSLLEKQIRKKSGIELFEQSFNLKLDNFGGRPSIASPVSVITPFLGSQQGDNNEIKSFTLGQNRNSNDFKHAQFVSLNQFPSRNSISYSPFSNRFPSTKFLSPPANYLAPPTNPLTPSGNSNSLQDMSIPGSQQFSGSFSQLSSRKYSTHNLQQPQSFFQQQQNQYFLGIQPQRNSIPNIVLNGIDNRNRISFSNININTDDKQEIAQTPKIIIKKTSGSYSQHASPQSNRRLSNMDTQNFNQMIEYKRKSSHSLQNSIHQQQSQNESSQKSFSQFKVSIPYSYQNQQNNSQDSKNQNIIKHSSFIQQNSIKKTRPQSSHIQSTFTSKLLNEHLLPAVNTKDAHLFKYIKPNKSNQTPQKFINNNVQDIQPPKIINNQADIQSQIKDNNAMKNLQSDDKAMINKQYLLSQQYLSSTKQLNQNIDI